MDAGPARHAGRPLLALLQQAIDTTAEGITISDPRQPDNPIIYANAGFERLTGYATSEVVGRNCRFLQGPGSDPDAVREIREAIQEGRPCTVELLNYRKEGTPFWNRLAITPLRDAAGRVTHFAGIQSDITPLRETQERLQAANDRLVQFERRITRELDQARQAQRSLLPSTLPHDRRLAFAAKYVPMTEISGDFYDLIELKPGVYGILVADVTGHGIHAALLAFMSALSFKTAAPGQRSTRAVLRQVNEQLVGKLHRGNFVAMFYAIVDANRRTLTYTQAGIPPALLLSKEQNAVVRLEAQSPMLGLFEGVSFAQATVSLSPGDKVLLYSDAISETMRADGEMLGVGGLAAYLDRNRGLDIEALVEQVYAYGQAYDGQAAYTDDLSLVGFELVE
jgi:sigma-B regulation protein RsbU (phosphoserine phosphatase)